MKEALKAIWRWLKSSNRILHFSLGIPIGMGADSDYCAAYVALGVSSAMEFKDKQWGGKWDWIDWSLTVSGILLGRLIRVAVFGR